MATIFKMVFGDKLLATPLDDYPVSEREREGVMVTRNLSIKGL